MALLAFLMIDNYNLSPQGDGNSESPPSCSDGNTLQLIPVRGRKRNCGCGVELLDIITTYPRKGTVTIKPEYCYAEECITTYPRKGTETRQSRDHDTSARLLQLTPARGRKPSNPIHTKPMKQITTHPRKGTVTFNRLSIFVPPSTITTYPRKGTVTRHRRRTCSGRTEEDYNLSPQNPLRRCAPALPKGELFQLPLPCTKLPLRGSWHGASRD